MLSNIERYKRNVEKLNKISKKLAGVDAAVSIVEKTLENPQAEIA
jgi:hypothetical protein